LAPLDMSAYALARALHLPVPRVNDIVREKRGITVDTALRLGRYFGTSEQFWLNLQNQYDVWRMRGALRAQIAAIKPRSKPAA
jgi:addiction module HigA family antidote